VLAERFEGKPLNSPNDIVCKLDGSIWFTDPPFGILGNYEGHVARGLLEGRPRPAILGPRTADHGPRQPPARRSA
jgi:sugar lactone lactonase YvrE